MSVDVFLLGGWSIQKDGRALFAGNRRSHKILELLKYFVVNRGKKLSSENIVENLWGDANLVDSQNTLRTQIFRLRQMLQEEGLFEKGGSGGAYITLLFDSGFYIFSLGEDCIVDTDLFEKYVKEAEINSHSDLNLAIDCYKKVVLLYKGEYLAENSGWGWAFPLRTRFRRLYVQSLNRLLELLKAQERHTEIVEYFEKAVCYEPLEESLNLYYLEALLALNQYRVALSHYNYITGRMYQELSVKPSSAMKSLYRKITAGEQNVRKAELWDLSKKFSECDESEGALCCDLEYFRIICNLEERRSIRRDVNAYLGLATIAGFGSNVSLLKEEAAMKGLKFILENSLRKGDVYTQWNQYQIILLLTDSKQEGLIPIGSRIRKCFDSYVGHDPLTVNLEFEPFNDVPSRFIKKMSE